MQNNGVGLELDVVAIVLLGGVSIFGGKGSVIGVVLGVLAFAGLQNALLLTNFNQEAAGIVTGALLLLSVFGRNAASLSGRLRKWRRAPGREPGHPAAEPGPDAPGGDYARRTARPTAAALTAPALAPELSHSRKLKGFST